MKLYLNLLQHRQLRFFFDADEAKRLKKQFVATYRDALGEIFATDWSDTGIDFPVIEQVMLARNRGQHGTDLTSFLLTHDDRTLAKHPVPFFISAEESQSLDGTGAALGGFLNPTIVITRDTLFVAIAEVEKLGGLDRGQRRARAALVRRATRGAKRRCRRGRRSRQLAPAASGLRDAPRRCGGTRHGHAGGRSPAAGPDRVVPAGRRKLRPSLLDQVKAWRGGSNRSTIYVFSFEHAVPQNLITMLRNAADGALRKIDEARGFPKCNASGDSRCLYVGHSFRVETRLRDHLGFGPAGTSSLHLKHWDGHPHDTVTFTAYRLSSDDKLLAQLLEEYLWDELKPLLGKRGGK